jgi:hypothetical protein
VSVINSIQCPEVLFVFAGVENRIQEKVEGALRDPELASRRTISNVVELVGDHLLFLNNYGPYMIVFMKACVVITVALVQ